MRYELLILKNGEYIPLDLGGDSPYMVLQVNTLAELKDINTSYSQSLSLPKSNANCAAFDYADDFQARSGVPYGVYPCALYCDGMRLLPEGFRLVVKSVTRTSFKCQIISNLKGLFTGLGDLAVSDLQLPVIPYTIEEIQASVRGERDYVFALSALHYTPKTGAYLYGFRNKPTEQARQTADYGLIMVNSFWPYFRLYTLVERIFAMQGYKVSTSVTGKPDYRDVYVSLSDMKPSETSFAPVTASASVTVTAPAPGTADHPTYPVYMLKSAELVANYGELDKTRLHNPDVAIEKDTGTDGIVYTATDCVNIKVRLSSSSNTADFRVTYRIRKYGFVLSDTLPVLNNPVARDWESNESFTVDLSGGDFASLPGNAWESDGIYLSPGEKIYIEANLSSAVTGARISTRMQIVFDADDNKVPAGGVIDPNINLDFKNQLEIVKLFVQLHGLTVQVDSDNKVVYMYPFGDLVERARTGVCVDWSDKVSDTDEAETAFTFDGYMQRNEIRYKKNDFQDYQDVEALRTNNANIESTRVMLDLLPLSSQNRRVNNPVTRSFILSQMYNVRPHYTMDKEEAVFYRAFEDNRDPVWPQTAVAVGASLFNQCPLWKYRAAGMHICEMQPMKVDSEELRIGYLPYNMQPPGTAKKFLTGAQVATYLPVSHFVNNYYSDLQNHVLDKVRIVTDYFYLTPEDVAKLDLFTPVYVAKYGQYFYIQKIDNYNAERITKVTLITINL